VPLPNGFSYTTNCFAAGGVTIPPGQTCTFSVTFTPASAVPVTASIVLTDNVPPGTQSISLSGVGFAPLLSIDHPGLTFSQIGSVPAPNQTVTLTNNGTDTLNVTAFHFNGTGFGYNTSCNLTLIGQGPALGFSLSAGNSCSFTVSFSRPNDG